MADLTVFIVDTNDQIVARKSVSALTNATSHTLSFPRLTPGTYTVYANTEGNDWFSMPSENESSFANYKDALLKDVTSGAPVVQNDRMPLTGKQEMTIGEGTSTRTVSMLRTVGKLSVNAVNQRTSAVTAQTPTISSIIPQTGWVFKHDNILTASNPLHIPTIDNEGHVVIPGATHLLLETLLYETSTNAGFTFTMTSIRFNKTYRTTSRV